MHRFPILAASLLAAFALAGCVTAGLRVPTSPNATVAASCMEQFVRAGTTLARAIGRLPDPPECSTSGGTVTFKAGGMPGGSAKAMIDGTVAVGGWRSAQGIPGLATRLTGMFDGMDVDGVGTFEVLRRSQRTTIDGQSIEHSAVTMTERTRHLTAVCVLASNETNRKVGVIVCRIADTETRPQLIAAADRIVATDLLDIQWQ